MLVFLDIHSGFLQMFNHNSTLVKSRANSDIQYGRGVIAHNKSVTFYHHMDFYRSPNYTTAKKLATGISCFELIPSNINLICPSPTQIVSYLSVGCPKGRHLVLKRPAASEPCDTVDTYTIGKEHFLHLDGTSPTQDKVVHYDLVRLGCPVRVDSSHNFLPQLELYDGEEFVRPVTGNFILWEEQGRTDYSYNATMKQAGCHKVAQTWSQIRDEQGMLTDWGQGWGPWNYRSCFEETNTVIDSSLLQRPYQILNSTGVSWLQFPNTHDSMYTFRARIVDPNYSFCDLEISFAVQTYGAQHPEDLTVTMITVGGIMGAVLLGLLGSYFVYRKQTSQAFATRMMLVKMLHKEDHSHQRESPVPKKRTSVLGDIWS
ncbi:cation channel sperm-associated protein subunit epsilon-like [Lingula anatina]|nr:cation channel sperm-associated protein subunit epsilon-like [Lingula anatina]|eukprot:XP_013384350.1 cation channel sperm-associated protein subunit epsilon-like [Lingula anatina]